MTCSSPTPAANHGQKPGPARSERHPRRRTREGTPAMSTAVFIGGRNIARSVRAPMLLAISLLQPVIWLALFSQTFGGLGGVAQFRAQGYQDYLSFLTPGMVVLSMLFTG